MKKILGVFIFALVLMVGLGGCSGGTTGEAYHQDKHGNDHEHEHAHGEFEWIGEFEFKAGKYLFHFGASEDETMDVGFIKMGANITDLDHHAAHLMETEKEFIKQESTFEAKPDYAYTLEMNEDHGHIYFEIKEDGTYAIVTEHMPHESNMQIFDENENEILPLREHEGEVNSH
ncbi:MAG: hypothetical protein GX958_00080 [Desulfitobacterium sp.]|nr:hypothetical protein [Desulfitobacterium sp.]